MLWLQRTDPDEKHQYEDEAEESDLEFIDDDDADESDSDAVDMYKATAKSMRNTRTWAEAQNQCRLCRDLRVVLRHLLGME